MQNKDPKPYQPPHLEPQAVWFQVTGISFSIGTDLDSLPEFDFMEEQ